MRIDRVNIGKVYVPNNENARTSGASSRNTVSNSDEVEISNRAVEVSKTQQYVLSLPDVREEKVQQYKIRIANNDYEISVEDLAQSILKSVNELK